MKYTDVLDRPQRKLIKKPSEQEAMTISLRGFQEVQRHGPLATLIYVSLWYMQIMGGEGIGDCRLRTDGRLIATIGDVACVAGVSRRTASKLLPVMEAAGIIAIEMTGDPVNSRGVQEYAWGFIAEPRPYNE